MLTVLTVLPVLFALARENLCSANPTRNDNTLWSSSRELSFFPNPLFRWFTPLRAIVVDNNVSGYFQTLQIYSSGTTAFWSIWPISHKFSIVISDTLLEPQKYFQTIMQTAYSAKYEVDLAQMPLVEEIPPLLPGAWEAEKDKASANIDLHIKRPVLSARCLYNMLRGLATRFSFQATAMRTYFSPALYRWVDLW